MKGGARSHDALLFGFLCHLSRVSARTEKSAGRSLAADVILSCLRAFDAPLHVDYSGALTALILLSILACYPHVTLDSPHCRTPPPPPPKHVGTYGKYSFLECHWQPLPARNGTVGGWGQSQAVTERRTNLTAFSITRRKPIFSAQPGGLCALSERKCSVASNDTALSQCYVWES